MIHFYYLPNDNFCGDFFYASQFLLLDNHHYSNNEVRDWGRSKIYMPGQALIQYIQYAAKSASTHPTLLEERVGIQLFT